MNKTEEEKKPSEIDKEISETLKAIEGIPNREVLVVEDRSGFKIEFASSKEDMVNLCSLALEMKTKFESQINGARSYIN